MDRSNFDEIQRALRNSVDQAAPNSRFPLDVALLLAQAQLAERRALLARGDQQESLGQLLTLLDITSTSASLAIKHLGKLGDDVSGIRDALVDLWGRSEAGRCLWFDSQGLFSGDPAVARVADLWETARLLAPDAIAIAMRLSEPVVQYVEFASQVINLASSGGGVSPVSS